MKIRYNPDIIWFDDARVSPVVKSFFDDWWCEGHQIISLSGPRNCAKSTYSLLLMLLLHEAVPGLKTGVVRCEQKTIKRSVIDTINELLFYDISDKRRNPFRYIGGQYPDCIEFENGGNMRFGGMDDANKVLGSAYDVLCYSQIEREDKKEAFSKLMGCMVGGRSGKLRIDGKKTFLFIGDCNPGSTRHWWYGMKDELKWYDFTHKEHPLFYDWSVEEWKEQGIETREGLKRTHSEGYMQRRMVEGEWCNATGAVYPQFDPDIHEVDIQRKDIPNHAKWFFSCDWGRINAVGLYAEWDGQHVLFKEIYTLDESVKQIISRMKALQERYNIPNIENCFVDHEIDNRKQMEEAGYRYTLALKRDVAGGIEDVRHALSNNLIKINKNSLDDPEQELAGKAQRLTDELLGLSYKEDEKQTGHRSDDLPDPKCPDHAADNFRYYIVERVERGRIGLPFFAIPLSEVVPGKPTFTIENI